MVGPKTALLQAGSLLLATTLVGCFSAAQNTPIDPAAPLTLEADPIVRTAPGNGQISVLDVNQQKVVFSGYVKKGDAVALDPVAKQLTVDGDIAAENLHGGDEFQISFDAAP